MISLALAEAHASDPEFVEHLAIVEHPMSEERRCLEEANLPKG